MRLPSRTRPASSAGSVLTTYDAARARWRELEMQPLTALAQNCRKDGSTSRCIVIHHQSVVHTNSRTIVKHNSNWNTLVGANQSLRDYLIARWPRAR